MLSKEELDMLADMLLARMASPDWLGLWEEKILRVCSRQEMMKDVPGTFLRACKKRGVSIRMDEDGKVLITNPDKLGADLRAVYIVYREDINRVLRRSMYFETHGDEQPNGANP